MCVWPSCQPRTRRGGPRYALLNCAGKPRRNVCHRRPAPPPPRMAASGAFRSGREAAMISAEEAANGARPMLDLADPTRPSAIPFDSARLDRLMEAAKIDVLLVTSKHNVQYLLGGHRSIFFDYMDATGLSRYLPIVIYPKGAPDKAAFIGHRLENYQREVQPFWTPHTQTSSSGSRDAMQKAIDHIRGSGLSHRRIGAELAFLPFDAATMLSGAFADAEIKDALFVLE